MIYSKSHFKLAVRIHNIICTDCFTLSIKALSFTSIYIGITIISLFLDLQNNKEKVNKFREIVDSLAKPNRYTLQALLKHLLKVAEYSEFNRMQIPNLAIVFGPTLMWPATESTNMALDLMKQNLVIEALLVEYDNIYR